MNKLFIALTVVSMACWAACTKSDEYKQYTKTGEQVYPGKADSLKGFAGHNRVLLTFYLQSDPTIEGVRIYWNNRTDSTELSIKRSDGVDTISTYVTGLGEASYNFVVQTFDGKGNLSVPSNVTVKSYGDDFQATLLNIPIQFSTLMPPDIAFVVWGAYDPNSGLIGAEVQYTDENGVAVDTRVPIGNTSPTAQFMSFQSGNELQYRTMYLPEPAAVDTFYSAYGVLSFP